MGNDIHDNSELLEKLISQQDFSTLDFVLFNGDMVDNMHSEKQVFDGFLSRAVKMFASELPFFDARGNHETRGLFAGEYIDYFPTPTGQPYYSFRQGPVFFIMLDGGEDKPDSDIEYHGLADFDTYRAQQASWLRQTLQSEEYRDAPVRIAVLHVPPVESTWHGQIEVEKLFIPLLNEAGIDLMLSGHLHSHVYIPAGEQGCEFPVLVNSNKHVTNIEADTGGISIEIRDELGRLFKQIRVDK